MILAAALVLASVAPQTADPRYELGWRLKALEVSWRGEHDASVRARLLERWIEATRGYFGGRTDAAARALDAARSELAGVEPSWCDSLALVPEVRLVDATRNELGLVLEAVYDAPRPARFELRLVGSDWKQTVEGLPWQGALPIVPGEGERRLVLRLEGGAAGDGQRELCFSAARALEDRLLELGSGAVGAGGSSLELATARGLAETLEGLAWEAAGETDLPGTALLAQAEACLAAARASERWPEAGASGERRLWVPLGSASVPIRLRVPAPSAAARADEPRALVLALHGAGGSENLFFEGYGAGAIVPLCEERGWILVAPRLAAAELLDAAALVDALAAFLPVDPRRVFLVGHSMGAMQAGAAINAAPGLARAAALLGGAGGVRELAAWRELPVFLAAGERDFARRGVEEVHESLLAKGSTRAVYRLYPATEHLTVVGEALPDAFAFFDAAARE